MVALSPMSTTCIRAAQRTTIPRTVVSPSSFRSVSRAYRTAAATSQQQLYLDFLAPSALKVAITPNSVRSRSRLLSAFSPRRTLATAAATTTTSPPYEPLLARAIVNPRTTEDGQLMQISLSPRAAHRLSNIAKKDDAPNTALRITIESGGCHGFQYLMSLTDLSKTPPAEDDTVFEGETGGKVVIDESSLELLNGSTVDYTMELIGSQFKVVGIPGATSSCGCGTSFDIKI